jgi:hypothetical protein
VHVLEEVDDELLATPAIDLAQLTLRNPEDFQVGMRFLGFVPVVSSWFPVITSQVPVVCPFQQALISTVSH